MTSKITFVLENFYPTHRAGTETYVLNLAKELNGRNESVNIPFIVQHIANILQTDIEDIAYQTSKTAKEIYKIT